MNSDSRDILGDNPGSVMEYMTPNDSSRLSDSWRRRMVNHIAGKVVEEDDEEWKPYRSLKR